MPHRFHKISMKCFLLLLCWGSLRVQAQSLSITSPTASQGLSGYSGFSFTATVSSAPSAYCVVWTMDAYSPVNSGCVAAPYSLPWNTFNALNGTHAAGATLYDALGAVVATAAPVSFTVTNTWPIATAPGMTVATGTALGSPWSGSVSVTTTITGAQATLSKNTNFFVDGIQVGSDTFDSSASSSFSIDTTKFPDGSHIIAVTLVANTGFTTFADGQANNMLEWSANVIFANPTTPSQVIADSREMFLAPGATHQLAPNLVNGNGSTTATSFAYLSENPPIATVNSSGLVTAVAVGAAGAASSARIDIMAQQVSGSDLTCVGPCSNGSFQSAGHPFNTPNLYQLLTITSANGWTAGTYLITTAGPAGNISLSACTNGTCTVANPSLSKTGNGTFTTGPTRSVWAMVTTLANPNPPIYHFGNDASVLSTYTPAKSFYPIALFQSNKAISATTPGNFGTDQPYGIGPDGTAGNGFLQDFAATGFNVIETGPIAPPAAGTSENTFQTASDAQVALYCCGAGSLVVGTNIKFLLAGDAWVKAYGSGFGASGGLFQTTRDARNSTWAIPALARILNSWNGIGLWVEGGDEYSDYGPSPFPGTQGFASGTQIVASAGVCSMTGVDLNVTGHFVISGSSITGMNSVTGATYTGDARQANQTIHFNCASVPNGTYNAANNPTDGLTIHPFASGGWLNNTTGTSISPNDYVTYQAYSTIKSQINAANTGRANWTFPPLGTSGCSYLYGFGNPAAGLSDYLTKFNSGTASYYLGARTAIFGLLGNRAAPTTGMGDNLRSFYGCFSPAAPLSLQNSSVPTNYGFQGYPLTVTSFTGNTLTFSAPHNLPNIVPGVSRLTLSGMSNAADNGNYYILSTPTATTMTVTDAVTDFTGGVATPTLTFQNGDTICASGCTVTTTLTISATGTTACGTGGGGGKGTICGDTFGYTGGANPFINRHRGQTFTLSGATGTGAASFNSRTFIYPAENVQTPTNNFGNHYREIPQGSSISGAATIIADNNFVPGRNGSTQVAQDPDIAFAGQMYNMILGGAMTRLYLGQGNMQSYNPTGGFVGLKIPSNITLFNDNTVLSQQLGPHPYWENYYSRPDWHGLGLANLLIHRLEPYILTSRLPTPDYGNAFECTARTGAQGQVLFCLNITNAPQTATFALSGYETGGQAVIQFIANSNSIKLSTIAAGTPSATVAVPIAGVAAFVFPVNYSAELQQHVISARLADVMNATKVVVRYGYDQYLLDTGNTVFDCGAGKCTLPVDRQIGRVFYRLIYLGTNADVLAISDVQTF